MQQPTQPTQPTRPSGTPRGGNPLATPAGAASLAVVLVALIAATVLVTGLLTPGAAPTAAPGTFSAPPSATPGGSATATPGGSASASPLSSFVRPTPTPGPTFTSYVVLAGESLNSVARRFNTSARSLAWWNRGTYPTLDPESEAYDPNHIEPGWLLVMIPGVRVDDANPPTPSPGPPTPSVTEGPSPSPASS